MAIAVGLRDMAAFEMDFAHKILRQIFSRSGLPA
ncbi:MAG: hypothetical protein ACJAZW_000908 [Maritalea sp.]|jgi:hypothetical protein